MRAIIAMAIITSASALEGFNETPGDSWLGRDKAEHGAAGLVIGGITDLAISESGLRLTRGQRLAVSIGMAALAGVLKEVSDSRDPAHHDASVKDATCTIAGGVLGAVVVDWTIHF
jgi:uncharacterized protein YfiM (DUF2279 family)